MFKVGDKVRLLKRSMGLPAGTIATVTSISPSGDFFRINGFNSGVLADVYELVEEATDEELAAEYRMTWRKSQELRTKLIERRYKIGIGSTTVYDHAIDVDSKIRIVKSETVTKLVEVTETIQKEI